MDPATRDHAGAQLLRAARSHALRPTRDDVLRAVDDADHGLAFAEWATRYLDSDNLLTPDELAIYTALDRSGEVDRLAGLHDLAEVQAVGDGDLRVAIDELRQSTDRISHQTETLRQQEDALSRLVNKQSESEARRRELSLARQQKIDQECKQLTIEVEELSQDLGFRLSDLEQQCRDASPHILRLVDSTLTSDDKLLSSLQKLGWELDRPHPDEALAVDGLREACKRLIETTAESVRVKLDLVYLEALVAAERSGRAKPATQDEVQALQQEVESLYSEILPVAQMSVEKQHLELAVDSISAKAGNSLRRTTDALEYINDCLDYLLDRMKSLRTRIETHQSHEVATAQIASSVRSEIGTSVTPPPRPSRPISSASPLRRSSPVRLAGRHGRSGSSSGQDDAPLEVLLRNLAVSIPPDARDGRKKVEFLARTVAERSLKADEVARAAHESFEASVTSQLRDAKLAIQLVRDSVLADSPFGDIKLSDPEIEASILVLDQEVEKARERLSTIERQKMPIRSVKREEIMQRFGPAKPF